MKRFSVFGSFLLFTYTYFTSSFVNCAGTGDYHLGCSENSQKIITFDEKHAARNFRISINASECPSIYLPRISLVILKTSEFTNIDCDNGDSFSVNITKEYNETEIEEGWGCSSSFSNYHLGDLVMNVKFNLDDALQFEVSAEGEWGSSYATMIATVYFELAQCGSGYFDCNSEDRGCSPSSQSDNGLRRCISKWLKCNDYPNCGMSCNVDESNETCHPERIFGWGDFQYMITTFLAALFFILSPTVIVFILFYRKRIRLQELQQRLTLENEMRAARENRMVGTISSRVSDNPPTYDDVHQTKDPPPCFCAAIAISEINEKEIKNATETNEENAASDTINETTKKCECTCTKDTKE